MPCDSSYLEASGQEVALSQVACLLDELNGKSFPRSHWNGYHPKVYSVPVDGHKMVSELCSRLQEVDVTEYSLEMQIWWRDHQKADQARVKKELKKAKDEAARKEALAKLTPYERGLLGLD